MVASWGKTILFGVILAVGLLILIGKEQQQIPLFSTFLKNCKRRCRVNDRNTHFIRPNIVVINPNISKQLNFERRKLTTRNSGKKLTIFTYDSKDMISKSIQTSGGWENFIIFPLQQYLDKIPDYHLIDMGSNIGVFSLQIAAMGRQVVAVDANLDNLLRLSKSLLVNGLQKNVTLVHNALDIYYNEFFMKHDRTNMGGTGTSLTGPKETKVTSILADDLLPLIPFRKAVLKIDIQGKEPDMLKGAMKLFSIMDIPLIIFEWNHREKLDPIGAAFIKEFFTLRGYKPYPTITSNTPFPSSTLTYTFDMVWKRPVTIPVIVDSRYSDKGFRCCLQSKERH